MLKLWHLETVRCDVHHIRGLTTRLICRKAFHLQRAWVLGFEKAWEITPFCDGHHSAFTPIS